MASADFEPSIKIGTVLSNKELVAVFRCSTQGGMRRSKLTNSLVLTTSRDGMYLDRWEGNVLHYCGMGLSGDQQLDQAQNRTLAESNTNGVAVYLLEVFAPNQYTYIGRVILDGTPYAEVQPGQNGTKRQVWMFPLRMVEQDALAAVPKTAVETAAAARARTARRLGDDELAKRATLAAKRPSRRPTTSATYERDPYVAELAKRRARGICQLCLEAAPFKSKKGEPYLETHHIVWLARGGEDSIANTVALCPNCHRRVHELEASADVKALKIRAAAGVS